MGQLQFIILQLASRHNLLTKDFQIKSPLNRKYVFVQILRDYFISGTLLQVQYRNLQHRNRTVKELASFVETFCSKMFQNVIYFLSIYEFSLQRTMLIDIFFQLTCTIFATTKSNLRPGAECPLRNTQRSDVSPVIALPVMQCKRLL